MSVRSVRYDNPIAYRSTYVKYLIICDGKEINQAHEIIWQVSCIVNTKHEAKYQQQTCETETECSVYSVLRGESKERNEE